MRYLIMSDIHANFFAMEAVLANSKGKWDQLICLGDTVGYGPHPNQCVNRLADLGAICIPGNHDWAALGRLPLEYFNPHAREALEWTRPRLNSDTREFLSKLKPVLYLEELSLFHGALTGPITDYILNRDDAVENFRLLETSIGLFGHSHHRFCFSQSADGQAVMHPISPKQKLDLRKRRYLLNPGSTGQPREGDPRASYGILNTRRGIWQFRKCAYPVEAVQREMRRYGLPEFLIQRLAEGR